MYRIVQKSIASFVLVFPWRIVIPVISVDIILSFVQKILNLKRFINIRRMHVSNAVHDFILTNSNKILNCVNLTRWKCWILFRKIVWMWKATKRKYLLRNRAKILGGLIAGSRWVVYCVLRSAAGKHYIVDFRFDCDYIFAYFITSR